MFVALRYVADGRQFPIRAAAGRQVLLGSGASCQVRIEAEGVAETHARLRLTEEGLELDNLTEPGFTRVNGYPISSYFLSREDRIEMGSAELILDISLAANSVTTALCRRCGAALSMNAGALCTSCVAFESGKGATRGVESDSAGGVSLTARTQRWSAKFPALPGYDLLGLLGEGNQGRVFKFRERATGKLVAVKQFIGTSLRAAKRFTREATALRRLHHENIVGLIDFRDGPAPLLVMEFVEGKSLTTLLETEGRLAPKRALSFLEQSASALACACEQEIVHRDVKPANILVTTEDRVKLTDFGLVRLQDSTTKLTVTGNWVGTPYYMSPEQLSYPEIDSRADVWGLAATLYHLTTGFLPLEAPNPSILFKRILNDPIDFRPVKTYTSEAFAKLLERMLEKEPSRRPWPAEVLRAAQELSG